MSPEQLHRVAAQVVSVFETGRASGDPGTATVLPDGAGISYGLHQATDGSDSLDEIVAEYIRLGGAMAPELRPWQPFLAADRSTLGDARTADLMALLRAAGADPVMRDAQEAVFGRLYWVPSQAQADELGLHEPLSRVALYDLAIHSGLGRLAQLRQAFPELPPSKGGDERAWTLALLRARRAWLAASSREVVRRTTYRVDSLLQLAAEGRWALVPPFTVRGQRVA